MAYLAGGEGGLSPPVVGKKGGRGGQKGAEGGRKNGETGKISGRKTHETAKKEEITPGVLFSKQN